MTNQFNDVVLRNGRRCIGAFHEAVRLQVKDGLADLLPTRTYLFRQLAGEAFCRLLSPGLRQQAGRCLALMVDSGAIGLVFASPEGKWPRRYRLSPCRHAATELHIRVTHVSESTEPRS